jgi:hypothetical protein
MITLATSTISDDDVTKRARHRLGLLEKYEQSRVTWHTLKCDIIRWHVESNYDQRWYLGFSTCDRFPLRGGPGREEFKP